MDDPPWRYPVVSGPSRVLDLTSGPGAHLASGAVRAPRRLPGCMIDAQPDHPLEAGPGGSCCFFLPRQGSRWCFMPCYLKENSTETAGGVVFARRHRVCGAQHCATPVPDALEADLVVQPAGRAAPPAGPGGELPAGAVQGVRACFQPLLRPGPTCRSSGFRAFAATATSTTIPPMCRPDHRRRISSRDVASS